MKKLFLIVALFLVSVSLFSQEREDLKTRKNIFRIHAESQFVFSHNSNSWSDSTCDYAIAGLGVSYTRLFSQNVGMTFVLGSLELGVEDPFNTNKNVDWTAGNYPLDIGRLGGFFKIGPYFRFGKIGISPMLDLAFCVKTSKDDYFMVSDFLSGISLGFDFFVTDAFLIYVEANLSTGQRFDEDSLFRWSPDDESATLIAGGVTIGLGFAF